MLLRRRFVLVELDILADEANEEWLRLNARGANGCAKFVYGAGR